MNETKQKLIEHAIKLIASKGITNFSMKKVTDSAGVSEALIYKHFDTKEAFLYCCFETIHKDIAGLFDSITLPPDIDGDNLWLYIKNLWFMYFDFLVKNGNRIIFYFEYRNSPYIRTILERDEEARTAYFGSFVNMFTTLKNALGISLDFNEDILWAYVLDVSGMYALRVIKGEITDSPEHRTQIWQLISKGMQGCLPREPLI